MACFFLIIHQSLKPPRDKNECDSHVKEAFFPLSFFLTFGTHRSSTRWDRGIHNTSLEIRPDNHRRLLIPPCPSAENNIME